MLTIVPLLLMIYVIFFNREWFPSTLQCRPLTYKIIIALFFILLSVSEIAKNISGFGIYKSVNKMHFPLSKDPVSVLNHYDIYCIPCECLATLFCSK